MWCESCCNGSDLRSGDTCSVCGTSRRVVGRREWEYPQTQVDEENGIPITRLFRKIFKRK